MPLTIAPLNVQLRIVRIAAEEKLKKHLESLGIFVNGLITIISSNNGSVICIIKEGRLALDKSIASKIFVA